MYISTTNSTNTLMKELLAKGEWREGERFLYTAFQTAGRGQAGNGWESEEGKNLLCSILLPPRKDLFYLNVLVSVAVHQVIRSVLCQAKPVCTLSGEAGLTIKWPNDIYYGDKKIAGILVENAILGSENVGGQRDRLTQLARAWLAAHPADRAWIVFDGHEANGSAEGRLRVSYTGGTGAHRADRLVCDYLRMRRYAGASGNVTVVTNDKDFRKEAERLGAKTEGIGEWTRK